MMCRFYALFIRPGHAPLASPIIADQVDLGAIVNAEKYCGAFHCPRNVLAANLGRFRERGVKTGKPLSQKGLADQNAASSDAISSSVSSNRS